VPELLAVDIGDVGESLAAIVDSTNGARILGGYAVEAGCAQQIGIGIADVEAVERLAAVEATERRAALERVTDDAAWGCGLGDVLGSSGLGLPRSPSTRAPRACVDRGSAMRAP
jgi:hypothetical protein